MILRPADFEGQLAIDVALPMYSHRARARPIICAILLFAPFSGALLAIFDSCSRRGRFAPTRIL